MPTGAYLRIQLKDEGTEYRKKLPVAFGSNGDGQHGLKKSHLLEEEEEEELNFETLSKETREMWQKALGKMDDPSVETLKAYQAVGE
jgi:hypothetical protein